MTVAFVWRKLWRWLNWRELWLWHLQKCLLAAICFLHDNLWLVVPAAVVCLLLPKPAPSVLERELAFVRRMAKYPLKAAKRLRFWR